MRFFTREWLTGGMADEEFDGVVPAYNRHLAKITPRLTPNLLEFVKTTNLHDGRIRRIVVDYNELMLRLYLRCGDLQAGYYDLDIRYRDLQIDKVLVDTLALAIRDGRAEIRYDEFDITDDNRYIHRMIFDPFYEISITFRDLEYEQVKQINREFLIMTEELEIIR